jgi:hypothetical protein
MTIDACPVGRDLEIHVLCCCRIKTCSFVHHMCCDNPQSSPAVANSHSLIKRIIIRALSRSNTQNEAHQRVVHAERREVLR